MCAYAGGEDSRMKQVEINLFIDSFGSISEPLLKIWLV
jgi:hypothetical protein